RVVQVNEAERARASRTLGGAGSFNSPHHSEALPGWPQQQGGHEQPSTSTSTRPSAASSRNSAVSRTAPRWCPWTSPPPWNSRSGDRCERVAQRGHREVADRSSI